MATPFHEGIFQYFYSSLYFIVIYNVIRTLHGSLEMYEFYLLVLSISHSFAVLTDVRYVSSTLEDKIRISARPCNILYFSNTEYVDGICKVLFTLPMNEMTAVRARYNAHVPEPLNRLFPDRVDKATAVKTYEARNKTKTPPLYPPGKIKCL